MAITDILCWFQSIIIIQVSPRVIGPFLGLLTLKCMKDGSSRVAGQQVATPQSIRSFYCLFFSNWGHNLQPEHHVV